MDVKPTGGEGVSDRRTAVQYNGAKVFSATKAQERQGLGEKITAWIRAHPECEIVDTVVTQSSDEAFHCLAVTLFYYEASADKRNAAA